MRRKFAPLAAFDCEAANEAAISPGLAELRVCANEKSLRETLLSKAVVAVITASSSVRQWVCAAMMASSANIEFAGTARRDGNALAA